MLQNFAADENASSPKKGEEGFAGSYTRDTSELSIVIVLVIETGARVDVEPETSRLMPCALVGSIGLKTARTVKSKCKKGISSFVRHGLLL